MPAGGARPGAGRKPRAPASVENPSKPFATDLTPYAYMLAVMNDPTIDAQRRDRMAIAAAAYDHRGTARDEKPGKREEAKRRGAAAAAGKFATPEAPRLVVSNG
jgi:hypothetical protein